MAYIGWDEIGRGDLEKLGKDIIMGSQELIFLCRRMKDHMNQAEEYLNPAISGKAVNELREMAARTEDGIFRLEEFGHRLIDKSRLIQEALEFTFTVKGGSVQDGSESEGTVQEHPEG